MVRLNDNVHIDVLYLTHGVVSYNQSYIQVKKK
jgi:hypothetical protein